MNELNLGLALLLFPIIAWVKGVRRHVLYFMLRILLPSQVNEKYYREGGFGYQGWIESPRFGLLAYRKTNGRLQFRW